jgi:hypothetical protein
MASRLTEAQRRNLIHVRDHGKCLPRSRAAYNCRIAGLSEFVWLYEDGTSGAVADKPPALGWSLVKVVGERLTPASRAALEKRNE